MPFIALKDQPYRLLAAEFFVIVLGVLVAFQVEEWRNEREDREIEANSLQVLLADIERGRSEYENLIQVSGTALPEEARRLLEFMLDPASLAKQVSDIPDVALRAWQWEPTSTAFDSMRDSGNMGLISDQELQSALLFYFDLLEPYFYTNRLGHTDLVRDVNRMLDQLIIIRPRADYLESGEVDQVLSVTMEEFVSEPDLLEALILLESSGTEGLVEQAELGIERLNQLEELINTHLETL